MIQKCRPVFTNPVYLDVKPAIRKLTLNLPQSLKVIGNYRVLLSSKNTLTVDCPAGVMPIRYVSDFRLVSWKE